MAALLGAALELLTFFLYFDDSALPSIVVVVCATVRGGSGGGSGMVASPSSSSFFSIRIFFSEVAFSFGALRLIELLELDEDFDFDAFELFDPSFSFDSSSSLEVHTDRVLLGVLLGALPCSSMSISTVASRSRCAFSLWL